jgi:phosphate acetyltransferase
MAFIDGIIEQAQALSGTVVLPEPEDARTIRAADQIVEAGIAHVVLVGDRDAVRESQQAAGVTREFEIRDPAAFDELDGFANAYYEMRKKKGMTEEKAREVMLQPIPHGIMMLHQEQGDGLVAGAIHSTGDTLRPALQILRTAPGSSLVSSFFFMVLENSTYLFADCGLVEDPNAEQLADIAVATAESALAFGFQPAVAMLSYSTKGSADSPLTQKVVEATRIAQEKARERFDEADGVVIDGELQADAAIVEKVGASKAPDSPVAGKANVLIFPELNSGNIGYKLVQRLAGADAYGPIIQGMRLPVNDLSRGCSHEDIVGVSAITMVQAMLAKKKNA